MEVDPQSQDLVVVGRDPGVVDTSLGPLEEALVLFLEQLKYNNYSFLKFHYSNISKKALSDWSTMRIHLYVINFLHCVHVYIPISY